MQKSGGKGREKSGEKRKAKRGQKRREREREKEQSGAKPVGSLANSCLEWQSLAPLAASQTPPQSAARCEPSDGRGSDRWPFVKNRWLS